MEIQFPNLFCLYSIFTSEKMKIGIKNGENVLFWLNIFVTGKKREEKFVKIVGIYIKKEISDRISSVLQTQKSKGKF